MEERLYRKLPVEVDASVKTIAPFDLTRPVRALPESVAVSGAASIVSSLESWKTEHYERERVKESFTAFVSLDDTLNGLVQLDRAGVLLQADVTEFTEHKRLLDVKVTDAPATASRFQLMPNRVSVRYTIPLSQFEISAVSDSFYASVPYDVILADTTGRVEPSIHVPSNLAVKDLIVETPRLQYYVILE
jgi:hypothetical protein